MRMTRYVALKKITILIDCGSTHIFIKATLAKNLACEIKNNHSFKVLVANVQRLACEGMLQKVPIEIQGYQSYLDLHLLPIMGSDVILGMQWMESLGWVQHNWKSKEMKFKDD